MQALVSNRGDGAIVVEDSRHYWLTPSGDKAEITREELSRIFAENPNFFAYEAASAEDVVGRMALARHISDALFRFSVLINPKISERGRAAAARELDRLLANLAIAEQLRRVLWAAEVSKKGNLQSAAAVAREVGAPLSAALTYRLAAEQETIGVVHRAWTSIDNEHFQGQVSRADVLFYAIQDGWFHDTVEQMSAGRPLNEAFRAMLEKKTSLVTESTRRVLKEWLGRCSPVVERLRPAMIVRDFPGTSHVAPRRPEVTAVAARRDRRNERPGESGMIDKVVHINRVAKVVKGGKNFSFSALVVVGDGNGKVGYGSGKAKEVPAAIKKAIEIAKKNMISVALHGTTIPHTAVGHYGAGKVLLKPASEGTGVIAGGPVRAVLESAGIQNILSKSLGTANPHNVVKATFDALTQLRSEDEYKALRGKEEKRAAVMADQES